jgi:foldase protein PrsA
MSRDLRWAIVCGLVVLACAGCGSSKPSRPRDPGFAAIDAKIDAASPEPGGPVQSGGVVARTGNAVITSSALESRLAMEAREQPSALDEGVPVPPAFTGCVAHMAAPYRSSGGAGGVPPSGMLRAKCASLYKSMLARVLGALIADEWVIGAAHEEGFYLSNAEGRRELKKAMVRAFATGIKAREYIAGSGENMYDMLFNQEADLLAGKIRAKVDALLRPVTPARVAGYYKQNKQAYTVKEARDLYMVRTKSTATARQVKRELAAGKVGFATVAERLIHEQPPYTREGYLPDLQIDAFKEGNLNHAIFTAKPHVVEGPVSLDVGPHFDFRSPQDIQDINGYYIFEVVKVMPSRLTPFSQVKASLSEQLNLTERRQAIAAYIKRWRARWRAMTDCSPGFVVRECRQFVPSVGEAPEDAYTLN